MTEANTESKSVVDNTRKDNYVTGTTARGTKSLNNGDLVAQALQGLTTEQVYEVADKLLNLKDKEGNPVDLRAKYAERNQGMQRMIVGNRIRGAVNSDKEGTPTIEELQAITAPMQDANEKALKAEKAEKAAAKKEAAEAKKAEKEAAKAEKEAAKAEKEAAKADAA